MRGNLMSRRKLLASILMACVLLVGFLGIAPVPNAASAGKSIRKAGQSGRNYVLEMKHRGRGPRIHLPIGPSYIYYDYPYYYSRGYYPTHIGGYVYYPNYYFSRSYYRGPGSARRQKARRH
jgi:hypothetical protein